MISLLSLAGDARDADPSTGDKPGRERLDYLHLTEALPGFAFVCDAAGVLLAVNAAMRTLGAEPGRDWRECVAADDRARVRDLSASAFANRHPIRFNAGWTSAQDETKALFCRLTPTRRHGMDCWVGVCREPAEAEGGASLSALSALVEAQAAITAAEGDAAAIFAIVVKAALAAVSAADAVGITVIEGDVLVYKAGIRDPSTLAGFSLPLSSSFSGQSLKLRRPLVSQDCANDPRLDPNAVRITGTRAIIVAPFFLNGQPFGVLQLGSAFPHAFCEADVKVAQLLVGALNIGISDAAEREAKRARRQSDAARDASEAQFRTAADAFPGLMFVTAPCGMSLYVNQGFCGFTGRDERDLLENGWVASLHPEDADHGRALWQNSIRTGEAYSSEHRFRRHDGEWRWHVVRALPVRRAEGGIEKWVGCCVDIHERRRSEEELQQRIEEALAERRIWAEIVDASETCIQVVSPDLRILAANPANATEWERWAGVRPQAGERVADTFRNLPHMLPMAEATWRRALAGETFTNILPSEDGPNPERWYEMKYSPIYGADGRLIGALRFGDNVTERLREQRALNERTEDLNRAHARLQAEMKRREETQAALVQAQKLEALGRLTSGVAHDFNNVTQAVAGGFAIIARRTKDPAIAEIARHGAAAAERGGQLVKQMLAFARQQVLAPQRVDLHAQCAETAPLLARTVGANVEIELACPPTLPPAKVDPAMLETALLNLAANARDAMPQGGRLSVRARESRPGEPGHPGELADRRAIAIAVADTGHGMSAAVLERALEPFFTTKGPGRGAGLGLAMVHGFVRQSSGALAIESREGEGATVTLFLPCDESDEESPATGTSDGTPLPVLPSMRILLVDDDDAVRGVTAAQLAELGHRVETANGVAAALARYECGAFDLVVSDVVMADADGLALAEGLRRRKPAIPILFITGHADRAKLAGEQVLDKPFSLSALAEALREAAAR